MLLPPRRHPNTPYDAFIRYSDFASAVIRKLSVQDKQHYRDLLRQFQRGGVDLAVHLKNIR